MNVPADVLKTNTCFTAEEMSETITIFPSGETAKTCPVTRGVVITLGGFAEAEIVIKPFSVPI